LADRVKIHLLQRGKGETVTSIAEELGYARNTVSLALNRDMFPEVRKAVLEHIDFPPSETK
jgi:hypothetical protein